MHHEEFPMTQAQLDCAIADATGESLHTVHRLGFSLLFGDPAEREPEDLCLVLDCPFCRRPVPYPGRVRGGAQAQAECLDCDACFEPREHEVYAADPAVLAVPARAPEDATSPWRP
jgi:hypothetical protein